MDNLQAGIKLAKEAQESARLYRAKIVSLGYHYISGGEYENQWAYWVHEDYLELAKKQQHSNMLDLDAIAEKLGLEELPEGAVLDDDF